MQCAVGGAQILDGEQGASIQCRQKADTGVDGFEHELALRVEFADVNRAGPAIALRTALLGARAAQVLTQVLQHRARHGHAGDFADGAAVVEADGMRLHLAVLVGGPGARYAMAGQWPRARGSPSMPEDSTDTGRRYRSMLMGAIRAPS